MYSPYLPLNLKSPFSAHLPSSMPRLTRLTHAFSFRHSVTIFTPPNRCPPVTRGLRFHHGARRLPICKVSVLKGRQEHSTGGEDAKPTAHSPALSIP